MQLMLAVLAGVLCGAAGMRRAAGMRGDAARLKRWDAVLARLLLLLRESAYALPDALDMAADGAGEPDAALHALACSLRQSPRISMLAQVQALHLLEPERPALERMAEHLSRGSLSVRCLAVEQAMDELRPLGTAAQEAAARDGKMWTSLGWTVGTCVTMMLL